MPRLVFKCPYIKGSAQNASQRKKYVRYISTREGVEPVQPKDADGPATPKQKKLLSNLLRDFPDGKGMFEYEDYRASPTGSHASELISRIIEEHLHQMSGEEKYLDYISNRPRAEKLGTHGLFTAGTSPLVLSQVAEEVSHHTSNLWLPILSLRREDAARLGYDNAERWRELLTSFAPEMAKAMKIPYKDFRWYAAFHNESYHPHVHMVCYSAELSKGFLTRKGISQIRSLLVGQIFRQELTVVYQEQTWRRDELGAATRDTLEKLISQIQTGALEDERLGRMLEHLSEKLSRTTGKKQYGYLKSPLKKLVDELVDELARMPQVEKAYVLWYELREEVLRTHRDAMPERLPLSRQKEFKQIKNIVIQEAVRLAELSSLFCDEKPEDESENDPVPEGTQAARYRKAKEILYDQTAPHEEKQAALAELEQLYDEGFSVAAHLLGKAYRDGAGVQRDEGAAEWWFSKAAMAGSDVSEYALGRLLEQQGRFTEAAAWYQKTVDQDNQYAQYHLAKLLFDGEEIPKDTKKSLRLLTTAAEQGNQFAQYTLGKLYLLGKEIPQDREAAIYWLTRSVQQGNEYAKYFLEHPDSWRKASVSQGIGRLLRHLGDMLRAAAPSTPADISRITDRRLLRKLREKQAAMGLKSSGHGNGGIRMGSS